MRLDDLQGSDNVEDRRGMRMPGRAGIGIGGLIIIGLISWATGIDPRLLLSGAEMMQGGGDGGTAQQQGTQGRPQDQTGHFVSQVLQSTEIVWTQIFRDGGATYRKPTLVLYTGGTRTACGVGQAAMGPFYCPNDQKVYLDTSFFRELSDRFGAPGQFAEAYVIAHEIGHHVQNQLGILPKVDEARQRAGRVQANQLSVRLELQADCFAGIWANRANAAGRLDPGDVQQALDAASAIGDDRLERQSQGYVVPDSFTHGTSAQRVRWFQTGVKAGSIKACDTFSGNP
ncbi:MAG TPA: neutral zinc metallopeptidase [Hyphomicrobiales bacterium]|nr:neutral zinc metallopeptidase [Hyphomicrobiales bacterium]